MEPLRAEEPAEPIRSTVTELFTRAIRVWEEEPALRWREGEQWSEMTFARYGAQVEEFARSIATIGLQEGQVGAILASNGPRWHISDMGMIMAGVVSCPIYLTSPPERVRYILEDSDSRIIFVEDERQRDKVEQVRDQVDLRACVVFSGEGCDGEFYLSWADFIDRGKRPRDSRPYPHQATPGDLLTLVYTSGTTGAPKGAMISHGNMVWALASIDAMCPAHPGHRKLSFLPLSHIGERVWSEMQQLHQGYTIWFAREIATVESDLIECQPTHQFAVPRILEKQRDTIESLIADMEPAEASEIRRAMTLGREVLRYEQGGEEVPQEVRRQWQGLDQERLRRMREELGFGSLVVGYSGGASISVELLEFFNSLGIRMIELYGMTEATGPMAWNRSWRFKLGTVGQVAPGSQLKLAEDGEILFRGPTVCKGYYRMPEATRELVDDDGWLKSGDLGSVDEEDFVSIIGRKKHIIITSGGKNIAPMPIEFKLTSHPYISQAVVVGDGRKYCAALLLVDSNVVRRAAEEHGWDIDERGWLASDALRAEVEAYLEEVNTDLSRPEQIKKYRLVDDDWSPESGVLTPTLKVRRSIVDERYSDLIESMYQD